MFIVIKCNAKKYTIIILNGELLIYVIYEYDWIVLRGNRACSPEVSVSISNRDKSRLVVKEDVLRKGFYGKILWKKSVFHFFK